MATFILIHGAWHGAWCWYKLVPALERLGHVALARDLPGHGIDRSIAGLPSLDDYVQRVRTQIEEIAGPVVLVGHSMGGGVISAVAEAVPERISKLIYLCAAVPLSGQSTSEAVSNNQASTAASNIELDLERGVMIVNTANSRQAFYADCPDEDVTLSSMLLCPQALAPTNTPILTSPTRWGSIPRSYILCENDHAITPELQQTFSQKIGFERVIPIASGHSPFFSMPTKLAEILNELAAS